MTKNQSAEMPFLDHLEELRWRIIWSAAAIVVGTIIGIIAVIRLDLINVLTAPLFSVVSSLGGENPSFLGMLDTERLVFLNLTEPFFFLIRLGVMVGCVLASPVIVYQAWAFLAPALEVKERRAIVPTFVLGLALFAAGVAMAYFLALPVTIRFLLLFGAEYFTPGADRGLLHVDGRSNAARLRFGLRVARRASGSHGPGTGLVPMVEA